MLRYIVQMLLTCFHPLLVIPNSEAVTGNFKVSKTLHGLILEAVKGELGQGQKWVKASLQIAHDYGTAAEAFIDSAICGDLIIKALPNPMQRVLAFAKGTVPDADKDARKNAQTQVTVMRGRLKKYLPKDETGQPSTPQSNIEVALQRLEGAEKKLIKERNENGSNVDKALWFVQSAIAELRGVNKLAAVPTQPATPVQPMTAAQASAIPQSVAKAA